MKPVLVNGLLTLIPLSYVQPHRYTYTVGEGQLHSGRTHALHVEGFALVIFS